MNDQKTPPIAKNQFDRVQVAIFAHAIQGDDAGAIRNDVVFSRSYKDNEGAFQRTHSFSPRDLPHLALAAEWAMKRTLLAEK